MSELSFFSSHQSVFFTLLYSFVRGRLNLVSPCTFCVRFFFFSQTRAKKVTNRLLVDEALLLLLLPNVTFMPNLQAFFLSDWSLLFTLFAGRVSESIFFSRFSHSFSFPTFFPLFSHFFRVFRERVSGHQTSTIERDTAAVDSQRAILAKFRGFFSG